MSVFSNESKNIMSQLELAYDSARSNLYTGIVKELTKLVDEKHALPVNDGYQTFHNVCTNEDETIRFITTDGEDIFLQSGDQDCFFRYTDYGNIDWDCFLDILIEAGNPVEIDWCSTMDNA